MLLYTLLFSISVDCPAVLSLAAGFKMKTQQPSLYAQLSNGDCCTQSSILCDGNNRVIGLNWCCKNLNGYINSSALDLLTELKYLQLQLNSISGSLPSRFPLNIVFLNAGSTALSGSIISLPPNLQFLHLDHISLNGDLIPFPNSLTNLRIDTNPETGSVFLNAPSEVMVGSTKISRVFINDFSHLSLSAGSDSSGYCDISYTLVYATQVAYLANVCQMTGIIQNTECSVVLTIATDLNMNAVKPDIFTVLQSGNCCTASGIQCDSKSHVIGINWSGMGLNGSLNTANIELLYSYLQSFNVSKNYLTGSIGNSFTSNLNILDLSNNELNGYINDIRLRSLRTLNLANNQFNGTFIATLPVVTYFNISNNQFNGVLPYMPFISTLDLSYNSISDNLFLNSPSTVNIMHNMITNLTFSSTSNLTHCNLQQNNLIGSNYPPICSVDVKALTNPSFDSISSVSNPILLLNSRRMANLLTGFSTIHPALTKLHSLNPILTTDSAILKGNLTIINLSFLYVLRVVIHFIILLIIAIRIFRYLSKRKVKIIKKQTNSEFTF